MSVSIREVDIGPCHALVFELEPTAPWAIVLPGAGYGIDAPLLWFARDAATSRGYNVLAVADRFDRAATDEPVGWVRDRFEGAISYLGVADSRALLIAKSLTSHAAGQAADAKLPAVWLTPLVNESLAAAAEVRRGIRANRARQLLIGGAADPSWDGSFANSVENADVLELAGADHALQVTGDPQKSLTYLVHVTDRIGEFIATLPR